MRTKAYTACMREKRWGRNEFLSALSILLLRLVGSLVSRYKWIDLSRISHEHCVSFEKKKTKTDGCDAREQIQMSTKCSPKAQPWRHLLRQYFGNTYTTPSNIWHQKLPKLELPELIPNPGQARNWL
ncbi:MAG: hypothetical protein CSA33_01845 [Desulfobulbus propionicus]|nr:MAG: hypothetical protein CSA33_01845 [Desulfobulbus propionicus]